MGPTGFVFVWSLLCVVSSYRLGNHFTFRLKSSSMTSLGKQSSENSESVSDLKAAMDKARMCQANNLSPGAGLLTADEQSDAAYADLINTSMDQRGEALSDEDLERLSKGDKMWEDGATTKKNKLGVLGDVSNALTALFGGKYFMTQLFTTIIHDISCYTACTQPELYFSFNKPIIRNCSLRVHSITQLPFLYTR